GGRGVVGCGRLGFLVPLRCTRFGRRGCVAGRRKRRCDGGRSRRDRRRGWRRDRGLGQGGRRGELLLLARFRVGLWLQFGDALVRALHPLLFALALLLPQVLLIGGDGVAGTS